MVATAPSVLVAHPSLPAKDVRELIAQAKAQPGQLSFAIGGIGSSLHLAGEAFKLRAGLYIVNIPYRGTAPAIADVLAGTVPLMFAPIGNTRSLIAAGKLKALGVTSAQRLPQWPTCRRSPRRCRGSSRRPGSACSARRGWRPSRPTHRRCGARRDPDRRDAKAPRERRRAAGRQRVGRVRALRQGRQSRAGKKLVRYSGAKPE
jgi:hypothetical protein